MMLKCGIAGNTLPCSAALSTGLMFNLESCSGEWDLSVWGVCEAKARPAWGCLLQMKSIAQSELRLQQGKGIAFQKVLFGWWK